MTGLFDSAAALQGHLGWLAGLGFFGFVVGVITGLFGVSGGFIITPLLNVLFGIPYNIAVGSSLCITIGTTVSGLRRHARLGNVNMKCLLMMTGGSICGLVLGVMAHHALYLRLEDRIQTFNQVMNILFIVLLTAIALLLMLKGRLTQGEGSEGLSPLQRLALPPKIDLPTAGLHGVSLPGLCWLGLLVGFQSGLLGIGGGVFYLPLLVMLVGMKPHQAVGTTLGAGFINSVIGTWQHALLGNVSLGLTMAVLAGSSLGVQLGAWICMKLHAQRLQRWFSVVVLTVVAILAVKTLRVFFCF